MKTFFLSLAILAGLASCNSDKTETEEPAVIPAGAATYDSTSAVTMPGAPAGSPMSPSMAPTAMPGQMQAPAQAAPAGQTAKGINPPHGQPGHRCDIPEGAPLNSAPAQAQQPQQQPQQMTFNVPEPAKPASDFKPASKTANLSGGAPAPAPAPVKTAAGMNPPHGEPGHRCDIEVGAPLPKE